MAPWGKQTIQIEPVRTAQVIDRPLMEETLTVTPTVTRAARPGAGELFKFSMAMGASFFIAVLVVAIADGADPLTALREALRWGGISLGVIWPLLLMIYTGGGIIRLIDHLLLASLRRREIDSQERVRLAEIRMQRHVSLASTRVDSEKREMARAALMAGNTTPAAVLRRTPAEQKLIDAIMLAYQIADAQTGYIPNDRPCPFGKRQLGTAYDEVIAWIADPARRVGGVVGAAPVATYDDARKAWRLDLQHYPTPDKALLTLTGNATIAAIAR